MTITADTNLLVRVTVRDDEEQARSAMKVLSSAESVAITLPCLCEFVWVLRSFYKFNAQQISAALDIILNADNVLLDGPAVEAGLRVHQAGGDFADGVIAFDGNRFGSRIFVSFDRKAVASISALGLRARLLT